MNYSANEARLLAQAAGDDAVRLEAEAADHRAEAMACRVAHVRTIMLAYAEVASCRARHARRMRAQLLVAAEESDEQDAKRPAPGSP